MGRCKPRTDARPPTAVPGADGPKRAAPTAPQTYLLTVPLLAPAPGCAGHGSALLLSAESGPARPGAERGRGAVGWAGPGAVGTAVRSRPAAGKGKQGGRGAVRRSQRRGEVGEPRVPVPTAPLLELRPPQARRCGAFIARQPNNGSGNGLCPVMGRRTSGQSRAGPRLSISINDRATERG